jgi:hypothetical protein
MNAKKLNLVAALCALIAGEVLYVQMAHAGTIATGSGASTLLSVTAEADSQSYAKDKRYYKSIVLKNVSSHDLGLLDIGTSSKLDHFIVCDWSAAARSNCDDFTRNTDKEKLCLAASDHVGMTLLQGDSCRIWFKMLDEVRTPNMPPNNESSTLRVENVKFDLSLKDLDDVSKTYSISADATLTQRLGVVIGGNFDSAGGVPASGIAYFDGQDFHPVGDGTLNKGDIQINALAMYKENLYAGGKFSDIGTNIPANNIAYWDGSKWNPLSTTDKQNGIGAPVNVLKVWQTDPKDKRSEELLVGFDWGNLYGNSGTINTRMLVIWKGGAWWPLSDNHLIAQDNKHCYFPLAPDHKWRIRSLAFFEGRMMVGGSYCVESDAGFVTAGSMGLRSVLLGRDYSKWRYFYDMEDDDPFSVAVDMFAMFRNSPTGVARVSSEDLVHNKLVDIHNYGYAPDVYALHTLKMSDGKEMLLVGGELMGGERLVTKDFPARAWIAHDPRVSFAFSSMLQKNTLVPVTQAWASDPQNAVRAFADGPIPDTFYMAGRNLADKAYVVRDIPAHDIAWATIGKWTSEKKNRSANWAESDMVLSMANVGGTLYVGGRFTDAGPSAEHVNNIAVLDKASDTFKPLGSDAKGVTRKDGQAATVNAILPMASMTISDVHME